MPERSNSKTRQDTFKFEDTEGEFCFRSFLLLALLGCEHVPVPLNHKKCQIERLEKRQPLWRNALGDRVARRPCRREITPPTHRLIPAVTVARNELVLCDRQPHSRYQPREMALELHRYNNLHVQEPLHGGMFPAGALNIARHPTCHSLPLGTPKAEQESRTTSDS